MFGSLVPCSPGPLVPFACAGLALALAARFGWLAERKSLRSSGPLASGSRASSVRRLSNLLPQQEKRQESTQKEKKEEHIQKKEKQKRNETGKRAKKKTGTRHLILDKNKLVKATAAASFAALRGAGGMCVILSNVPRSAAPPPER